MPTGAGLQVGHLFRPLAGVALGLLLASCHASRPSAVAAHDAAAAAPTHAAAPVPPPPRGKQIAIAYSSNLLGEYEPCG